jgi:LPS export ABC transporter protein LptC
MEGRLIPTLLVFGLVALGSCTEQKSHTAPAVNDRDSASMMVSYGVNTLISDSGVIKYRIVTERWEVNTVKNPPRWIFERGIFLEQFDETFHIAGHIQADTAWYYDQQKLWELRGRVTIRNVNGLHFSSEELWWDGIRHEFYSYQFSRLVTPERTLEGTYFRSDENMTHYEVTNSVGSFQTQDLDGEGDAAATPAASTPPSAPAAADTVTPPMRPAATRRAATQKSNYKE